MTDRRVETLSNRGIVSARRGTKSVGIMQRSNSLSFNVLSPQVRYVILKIIYKLLMWSLSLSLSLGVSPHTGHYFYVALLIGLRNHVRFPVQVVPPHSPRTSNTLFHINPLSSCYILLLHACVRVTSPGVVQSESVINKSNFSGTDLAIILICFTSVYRSKYNLYKFSSGVLHHSLL